ncbi:putative ribonuclease H1 [Sugiyamaella lignohabitans]|uniref:Putative ribonuclease H1 n=1 Tax=Sugiyamaella lignohabitans TaxID=796027 RepID=A0A167BXM0_9ASCO|nr:putative ribonuclease H1 [Sugiyamaella lignohabitans]ANB10952.1 putative ribonuclease H1 [Sugiyamaella lignohabitans]
MPSQSQKYASCWAGLRNVSGSNIDNRIKWLDRLDSFRLFSQVCEDDSVSSDDDGTDDGYFSRDEEDYSDNDSFSDDDNLGYEDSGDLFGYSTSRIKIYAVKRGREKGIFSELQTALDATYRFSHCAMKSFTNFQAACDYMKYRYYAVQKGHVKGIFRLWANAVEASAMYPGSRMKSFKSLKLAKLFLALTDKSSVVFTDGTIVDGPDRGPWYGIFYGPEHPENEFRRQPGKIQTVERAKIKAISRVLTKTLMCGQKYQQIHSSCKSTVDALTSNESPLPNRDLILNCKVKLKDLAAIGVRLQIIGDQNKDKIDEYREVRELINKAARQ